MWTAFRRPAAATLVLGLGALGLVPLAGCDELQGDPAGTAFNGMAVSETDDPTIPVVAVHESGEALAPIVDPGSGAVTGAVFHAPGRDDLVVRLNPDGTPARLVVGEWVVVFSNVRPDRADLVVIEPGGALQVARDVPYDVPGAREAARALAPTVTLSELIRYTGIGIGIPACLVGAAIAGGAVTVTGGAAAPLAVATAGGCASTLAAIIEVYRQQHGNDDARLRETQGAISNAALGLNLAGCASAANVFACVRAIQDLIRRASEQGAITEQERQALVQEAAQILQHGGGDLQFQLTWDNGADVDLWVTEPSGERIYYGHRTSATGGQLDVDDTNGHGPENIFWPPGQAPVGSYLIDVDHFSGPAPSGYLLKMIVNGDVSTLQGSVAANETRRVFVLDYDGGGIVAPPAPSPAPTALRADPAPAVPKGG